MKSKEQIKQQIKDYEEYIFKIKSSFEYSYDPEWHHKVNEIECIVLALKWVIEDA